jgi:hypothetical protein
VIARRLSRLLAGAFALSFAISPARTQYGTPTPDAQPNNYPPALPARNGPGPNLVFDRIGEITLPGPLAQHAPWIVGGRVVIPVEGGLASVTPESGSMPSMNPGSELPAASEWVLSSNGKRRYRATLEGRVEAEHRTHRGKRWSRSWRIRAPNAIPSPPLLVGPRLCYAGLDDRVTCVRASNGHRLWSADLGDRLSRPLTLWPAVPKNADDGAIVLAVPDDGASVIALDAYDGRRVATYELPAHHRFASPALVTTGDTIAIARKGYDDREAAMVLLRQVPPPPSAPPAAAPPVPPAAVPYNGPPPTRTEPSGR